MAKLPLVSVIIPTYNEEKQIGECLESVKLQTYKKIEIIVVDSERTKDKTAKIAGDYTQSVYKYGSERSMQRNYGAKKAKGEYLLFVDADMKLGREVVEQCVGLCRGNKKLGGVIIPEKSYGESYWAKCKALERNCYIGDETIEAARFFSKELFLKAGGYEQSMVSGEDWVLSNKLKSFGKLGRVRDFILHNEGKLSLLKDIKKKLYYAQESDEYLGAEKPGLKQMFLFVFRPSYFRNWRMLVSDPFHLIGMVVMKFLEFLLGAIFILPKTKYFNWFVAVSLLALSYFAVKNSFQLALSGDDWLMHWMTKSIFETKKVASIWNPLAYLCTYCPHWPTLSLMESFFGYNPFYYYLVSLLLRAAAAFSVYLLLRRISNNVFLAVLAGAFFAVGYLGIETTDWVFNFVHYAGIAIASVFLIFYFRAKRSSRIKDAVIAAGLYLLALAVSPPRMHGLLFLVVLLELAWLFLEGREYKFKPAIVRIVFIVLAFRFLFAVPVA